MREMQKLGPGSPGILEHQFVMNTLFRLYSI